MNLGSIVSAAFSSPLLLHSHIGLKRRACYATDLGIEKVLGSSH
jgi:hypothetical protein